MYSISSVLDTEGQVTSTIRPLVVSHGKQDGAFE